MLQFDEGIACPELPANTLLPDVPFRVPRFEFFVKFFSCGYSIDAADAHVKRVIE